MDVLKDLVFAKVCNLRGERLVAICDEELLGKKIHDEDRDLTIHVNEFFYKGERMKASDAVGLLKSATIANLTGKKIVDHAIKAGFVKHDAVAVIAGIPHAQIVRM